MPTAEAAMPAQCAGPRRSRPSAALTSDTMIGVHPMVREALATLVRAMPLGEERLIGELADQPEQEQQCPVAARQPRRRAKDRQAARSPRRDVDEAGPERMRMAAEPGARGNRAEEDHRGDRQARGVERARAAAPQQHLDQRVVGAPAHTITRSRASIPRNASGVVERRSVDMLWRRRRKRPGPTACPGGTRGEPGPERSSSRV